MSDTNNNQNDGVKKVIRLNPLFYPLDVIYSASYVMLEKAYFSFDGDPKKEVKVSIVPKEGYDVEEVSNEFSDELVNYLEHKSNYERNKDIRHIILQKALETNSSSGGFDSPDEFDDNEGIDEDELFDSGDEDFDLVEDDPEGIAIPWDEKYGNNKPVNEKEIYKKKSFDNAKTSEKNGTKKKNNSEEENKDTLSCPDKKNKA